MLPTYQEPGPYYNPINFCSNRNNRVKANEIIQANLNGLSGEAATKALKVQDYARVLRKVWGERDGTVRVSWLREQGYAPFILPERALAELKANPTKETLLEVTLPLIRLGSIRLRMDMACSNDSSLEGGYNHVENVYAASLESLAKKYSVSLQITQEEQIGSLNTTVKLFQNYVKSLEENPHQLPKADWLQGVGRAGFKETVGLTGPAMKPEETWYEVRLDTLKTEIEKIREYMRGIDRP